MAHRGSRDGHFSPGRSLRIPPADQEPRLHRGRAADAGPRHRRQHGHLQRRQRRDAAAAALQGSAADRRHLSHGRRTARADVGPQLHRCEKAQRDAAGRRRLHPDPDDSHRPRGAAPSRWRRGQRLAVRPPGRAGDDRSDLPRRRERARQDPGRASELRPLAAALRRRPGDRRQAGDPRRRELPGGRGHAGEILVPGGARASGRRSSTPTT